MSTITWLHISDLHFRADKLEEWNEDVVLRELLADVRKRVESDGLRPDFVAVTGDIAFSGAAKEYLPAQRFLDELLSVTHLSKESLLLVPGNHDVDRDLITQGAKLIAGSLKTRDALAGLMGADEDRRLLFRRFASYAKFVKDYLGSALPFSGKHYFHVRCVELARRQVALLALNSAWLAAGDEDRGHLALGERQVREALDAAQEADLRIALMHHPFDWLYEFDRQDCEALLTHECDFMLHGHLHQTGLQSVTTPDSKAMAIAAGACYKTRRHANAYNFVQLDLERGQGTVYLRRYSDQRGGFWTRDVTTYRNVDNGEYVFPLPGYAAPVSDHREQSDAAGSSAILIGSGAIAMGPNAIAGGENAVVVGGDVRGDVIVSDTAARSTRSTQTSLSCEELRSARERYLTHLVDRYQYLDFRGMGISDRVPLRLPLVEMYVPLKARIELPEGETWGRELRLAGRPVSEDEAGALGSRVGGPVPLLDLLEEHDGLIILGDPGAGKTTFLKYLALRLAQGQGEALRLGARLPILVPLSAYAGALAEQDVPLDEFIVEHHRNRGIDLPLDAVLSEALAAGGALVLLDGLDEVRELSRRHLVVKRVEDFFSVQRRNGNKFVLTSRVVGYREVRPSVEGLAECTLVDFEAEEIEQFVEKWTAALERAARGHTAVAAQEARREREELLNAIHGKPGVRRLASNPLLLTILALMKRQGVALPERRAELYEKYVETLLNNWNLARGLDGRSGRELDVKQTVRVLAPLALWMQETSAGVGLAKREDVRRKLEEIYQARGIPDPEQAAGQLLEDVHDYAGLLLERGPGEYGFIHLTFQEYLAAVAIAQRGQSDLTPVVQALGAHVGDDNWHEPTLLTIGYVGLVQQRDEAAGQVLAKLIEAAPGEPGQAVALAGEAAADVWPGGMDEGSKARIVEALVRATGDHQRVSPVRRGAAGRALGKLNDPRPEVATVDGMQLCFVPPGPFWMGEGKETGLEEGLTKPYWIGRYPVTNAQFQEFVDAAGYGDGQWWREAEAAGFWNSDGFQIPLEKHPWKGTLPDDMLKDLSDREPRDRPHDHGEPYNLPNHPVVGVTWYDSLAFVGWLTARVREGAGLPDRWGIRLPSEAEWEKAARGGLELPSKPLVRALSDLRDVPTAEADPLAFTPNPRPKRTYPWGIDGETDKANANHANYCDTKIQSSSAVGCFPAGASPYGCEDLSGNVWEWTMSLGDGRDDLAADEKSPRVLRGGAFYDYPELARCAYRRRDLPDFRFNLAGFRLLLSPF